MELCETGFFFDYNELQNALLIGLTAQFVPKGTEGRIFSSNLMDKQAEKLVDQSCPHNQELVESDKQIRISSSYPFRNKTTYSSLCSAKGKIAR